MNGQNCNEKQPLLKIENLTVAYGHEIVLEQINLQIFQKEILAIVGESGSGKSTLARAIMNLLPAGAQRLSGQIYFQGEDVSRFSKRDWQRFRGNDIAMIFQNPSGYLNPVRRIGKQFIESIRTHHGGTIKEAEKKAVDTLRKLDLKDPMRVMQAYPFQLSGGMNQRVAIAMATAMAPRLVIADEPTSALDVITQRKIVEEMKKLREREGASILMITHHIGCAAFLSDRIVVMREGCIEEEASTEILTKHPATDYTHRLLEAVPKLGGSEHD